MKQYSVSISLKEGYCHKSFKDIDKALEFTKDYVKLVGNDDIEYIRIDPEKTEEEAQ